MDTVDKIKVTSTTTIQFESELKEVTKTSILGLLFCDILQQIFDIYLNTKDNIYFNIFVKS